MPSSMIVGMSILAAVIYGIAHDQVTAHLCVEYFTIGHERVFPTDDPTLLAFGWGVIATWWAGLLLGVPLAVAARAGKRPKRDARSLIRPIAQLLGVMAVAACLAGLTGYFLAANRVIRLVPYFAEQMPADRHALFLADGWAHSASYLFGFVGGLVVIVRVWLSRQRLPLSSSSVESEASHHKA